MKEYFNQRILPAVTFEDVSKALKVAETLLAAGLNVMEVPFRTKAAADSIKMIKKNFPELIVGAGTLLSIQDVKSAKEAGAQFGLAPGLNPSIVKEAQKVQLPFVPGVMTPSEVAHALELNCFILKLFPASLIGGVEMIKTLSGPFGFTGVKFIPMGGVSLQNMNSYLALKEVIAVGGSWIATTSLISQDRYKDIETNAREAVSMALIKEQ
jgi:2-dehydro-3-deoxyphosphogluconate aldolase / (4S)-4-hydroxy-2-oxoglutarate aldolase